MFQTASNPLIGQAQLMQDMFNGDDLSQTAAKLINKSTNDEQNAEALLDLSMVLILRGNREVGLATQLQALKIKQRFCLQAHGEFRLLILKTPGDFMANTPIEFLIDNPNIAADVLYLAPDLPYPTSLQYDLVFVAVSEMDQNIPVLSMIDTLLKQWQLPFINNPDEIPILARDRACELMDTIRGVYMPQNIKVSRQNLEDIAELQMQLRQLLMQDRFPLLVRPVDSHAGQGLRKISSHEEIPIYLAEYPQQEFYMAPFVDYRSRDQQFRKYRIVFIKAEPFLCHMAISSDWMVHYLNAGMSEAALKRDEEASNMLDFSQQLGARQRDALAGIAETIDLDYFGIDCAETPDGQLLVFELANAMVVHDMDPVATYPYKKPVMKTVFDRFQQMLFASGGSNPLHKL